MANLEETGRWEAGIYQFETSDPVMGGPNGIDNLPTRQLANRTLWLKNQQEQAARDISGKAPAVHNHAIADITGLRTALDGLVGLTGNQNVRGVKTFSDALHTQNAVHAGGIVTARYANDWVGFQAQNPTEGKGGFFDLSVNNIVRGGTQITGAGGGEYRVNIQITPPGSTATDRRINGLSISHNEIGTAAYGKLHEYFARNSDVVFTHYPNFYQGADVFRFKKNNLMVISLYAHGWPGEYSLPEAFSGQWLAFACDRGTGNLQLAARPIYANNNRVELIRHSGTPTEVAWGVLCIGFCNR